MVYLICLLVIHVSCITLYGILVLRHLQYLDILNLHLLKN